MRYRLSSSPSQRNSASSKPIVSWSSSAAAIASARQDYDVLEDGKVVGRIFHLEAAAPEGRPWMWASGHGGHIERAAHGYAATHKEAMDAFAKELARAHRGCRNFIARAAVK